MLPTESSSVCGNNPNTFRFPENVLGMLVSQKSIDNNKTIADLVQEEALWKQDMLELSLYLGFSFNDGNYFGICSAYYQLIQPLISEMSVEDIHISFSRERILRSYTF